MIFSSFEGDVLRYVEKQSRIETMSLCESEADQHRLEELLDDCKPSCADVGQLHWLLRSAFRYPPLRHGSRFGRRFERGIFYASLSRDALLAEAAFYAWCFYTDMQTPPLRPVQADRTVLQMRAKATRMIDVRKAPDWRLLVDPGNWSASQDYGTAARDAGAEAIGYPSARIRGDETMSNMAILEPSVLADQGPPKTSGAFTIISDGDGVRVFLDMQPSRHYPAKELGQAPWRVGKSTP